MTDTSDGNVLVEATVADTRQLRWWLQGFGGRVEVLEPQGLRKEFRNTPNGWWGNIRNAPSFSPEVHLLGWGAVS